MAYFHYADVWYFIFCGSRDFACSDCRFGGMLAKGISLLNRSARLKKYLKIIGKGQFCPIDMLVQESGRDKAFILKDLQKMIQKKALPRHIWTMKKPA